MSWARSASPSRRGGGPRLLLEHTRRRAPVLIALRAVVVLLVWAPVPVTLGAGLLYGAYQSALPETPAILAPPPGSATRVLTLDHHPVGGLHRGLAPWAEYDELPPSLVLAFLAAEDDEFFVHEGFDATAIARAALANLRAGAIEQGGSTITQQLAKMFVGSAQTYERKLIELMVARRLEAAYSKAEILESYLNRIYLGAGAYGVVAAARIYFDHSLAGLTLAEMATLAGIASAPSAFEPYDAPERARQRRDWVLQRMLALGFASEAEATPALEAPLELRERGEVPEPPLPYVTDAVRAELSERYGRDVWQYGALNVQVGVHPLLQRYAEAALREGVAGIDRRQGYRGPLRRGWPLSAEAFDAVAADTFAWGESWPADERRVGLVTAVTAERIDVRVDGAEGRIDAPGWRWAYPYDSDETDNDHEAASALDVVEPGDVVMLERTAADSAGASWRLAQTPRLEGALIALDLDTGYVLAMAGGVDYDRSQFNRSLYGCRQPGSTFKPVIYSAALDAGRSLVSRVLDAPIQLAQSRLEIWRPRNADRDFRGPLSVRDALILSRNLPTVRLFREVGAARVVERARHLGLTTPMDPTDALSLGASCVYPVDVAAAYDVFANGGFRRRPVVIVSAVDGRDRLVVDRGVFFDASASASAVLFRSVAQLEAPPRPVIDPRTAYLMRHVLSDVVRLGTGYPATRLGLPAAGKTGTTNAYDAWFVGFTESVVATVWVGSDRNTRDLGRGETGAEVALPIWVAFMRDALAGREQGDVVGEPPDGVELLRVDLPTGLLAQEEAPGAWLPFRNGTAPYDFAPTPEQVDLMRIDRVDSGF